MPSFELIPLSEAQRATRRRVISGDVSSGVLKDLATGPKDRDAIMMDLQAQLPKPRPRIGRTVGEVLDKFAGQGLITLITPDDDHVNGSGRYQLTDLGMSYFQQIAAGRRARASGVTA